MRYSEINTNINFLTQIITMAAKSGYVGPPLETSCTEGLLCPSNICSRPLVESSLAEVSLAETSSLAEAPVAAGSKPCVLTAGLLHVDWSCS